MPRVPAPPVPLVGGPQQPAVAPTRAEIIAGAYPLQRILWLRLPLADGRLSPEQRLVARWALSREGQEVVAQDGLLPIPSQWAQAARDLLARR